MFFSLLKKMRLYGDCKMNWVKGGNFNTVQNLTPGPSPKERGGVKP